MARFARPLIALLVVTAGAAFAQTTPAAPTQDKAEDKFNEIERGFWVGGGAGPFFMLNPPAPTGSSRPFSPGQAGVLEVGMDLGPLISVGVFVQGTANHATGDYSGFSVASPPQKGDFSSLIPGAAVKVSLIGLPDAQGTQRTFLTLRAGAGYSLFAPAVLLPKPDILVFAAAGVEYFTRLRHFSIGLEVAGTFLVGSGAIGVSAMPKLRYAF